MKDLIKAPKYPADVEKWQQTISRLFNLTRAAGTTTERPNSPEVGQPYFDTTLGKPVWFKGPGWVDASGVGV